LGGGSKGRISHEAIKADRNWEEDRRQNSHLDINAKILLGIKYFGELNNLSG